MSLVARWRLDSGRFAEWWPAELPSYPLPPARRPFCVDGPVRPCAGPGDVAATKLGPSGTVNAFAEHHASYSIQTTGVICYTGWLRPDVMTFPGEGSSQDYVHPFAKVGEYALRFYSSTSDRAGQLAAYVFNPQGGFGSGARYTTPREQGLWTHVAVVMDWITREVALHVNGVEAQSGERTFTYHVGQPDEVQIVPQEQPTPLTLWSRNGVHFFRGGLYDWRVYNHRLSTQEIADIRGEVEL